MTVATFWFFWDQTGNNIDYDKIEKETLASVAEIKDSDHVFGNRNAPIKIFEYSNTECPYCKEFHLKDIPALISDYDDKIVFIYRHYPLKRYPKGDKEGEAVECAGELGGERTFWKYLGKIYEITPTNNKLDPNILPKVAVEFGLDKNKFLECLNSNKYSKRMSDDGKSGKSVGIFITPSVIVSFNGNNTIVLTSTYTKIRAVLPDKIN